MFGDLTISGPDVSSEAISESFPGNVVLLEGFEVHDPPEVYPSRAGVFYRASFADHLISHPSLISSRRSMSRLWQVTRHLEPTESLQYRHGIA